jgi:quinol monooxygenase YgiN
VALDPPRGREGVAITGRGEERDVRGDAAGASPAHERSGGMYARSTTVRGIPQAMDEGIAYVRDTVMPAVQQMNGCIGLSMLSDRDSGRCIITTSWADADAMKASADGVVPMRRRAAEIMGGPAEVQEWEIAVMHRMHNAHHGACARVIWTEADPAGADRMIDTFRMGVLPRLEDLPGCCSVSVMLDRGSGRAVVTTTYDSPQDMAQATEKAMEIRREFTEQMNATVTDVLEFELVVAHLRVPETV